MKQKENPNNQPRDPIKIQAMIWRASDRAAAGTPPRSPERVAEYLARQQLRAAIDQAQVADGGTPP